MLTPKTRKGFRRIEVVTTLEIPEKMTDREAVQMLNRMPIATATYSPHRRITAANFKKLTENGSRTKY